jgi:hypothetical protein
VGRNCRLNNEHDQSEKEKEIEEDRRDPENLVSEEISQLTVVKGFGNKA